MCSANPSNVLVPYGLKVPNPNNPYLPFGSNISQMALELQRAQLYDYSTRLQYGFRGFPNALGLNPYHGHPGTDPYLHSYLFKDPRARFIHEEPKPNQSYIGLIAMAILSSRDKKLVLSDIYQWILDNYPYFRTRGPGWRNSIRHNLSLNDCFIKSGRSANGKGHYWAIHPANVEDFQKGDFRRRRAQRRVRKHMGLSVPDDDDSPVPSPTSASVAWDESDNINVDEEEEDDAITESTEVVDNLTVQKNDFSEPNKPSTPEVQVSPINLECKSKKRLFDMESLLAPDTDSKRRKNSNDLEMYSDRFATNGNENDSNQDPNANIIISKDSNVNDFDNQNENNDDSDRECTEMPPKENTTSKVMISNATAADPEDLTSSVNKETSQIKPDIPWKQNIRNYSMMASRPSAFQQTRLCSWNNLSPFMAACSANSPLKGHFPLILPRTNIALETAYKWQETMAQIIKKSEHPKETLG